jgi:uncharacterized protein (DUF302 family)
MSPHEIASEKAPARIVKLVSRYDYAATVSRFKETLQQRGITLFAVVDQSAAAALAGLNMRPTTLFLFGNPQAGTPIMAANPYAAVELPLRAVVSGEHAAGVHIYYQDVMKTLEDEYGLAANLLEPMRALAKLMAFIAGQE